jgi:hypothetical protein
LLQREHASSYLRFWGIRSGLCTKVLANAIVDLLLLLLVFFALSFGYASQLACLHTAVKDY